MTHVTRRTVLGGLVIGVCLPSLGRAQSGAAGVIQNEGNLEASFAPNAFIRIADDDTVTVLVKHIEFGQGPYTGLTTLVAEEMDADWGQMQATSAPANVELYVNSAFGIQGTGGSTAMKSSYDVMRKAGAAARAMLVEAAAQEWGVPAEEITIAKGRISHSSGKEAGFGAFAEAASKLEAPKEPQLKDPKDFTLIGTDLQKVDTIPKTNGNATFTIDVMDDNMLVAAVLHPPTFGAKLKSFDDAEARKVPGVVDIKAIPEGIAVYSKKTYPALKARELIKAEWDEAQAETRSTEEMMKIWSEAAAKPGMEVEKAGDIDTALTDAGEDVHEAEFRFPFLAHAPMEPIDGVVQITGDGAVARLGSQLQTVDKNTIASVLGIDASKVEVETLLAGGSFGRRAQPTSSMAAESAQVAKAAGHDGPVKMIWTREDDIKGGWYRPLTVHRMRGAVDAQGRVTAWEDTIATPSIVAGSPFEQMIEDGIDPTSVEGARGLPYAFPNTRITLHDMQTKVPVLWWRSVGHTHTAYATEVFLDELLEKAGVDPVEGRLMQLGEDERHRKVLERVAEISNWPGRTKEGKGYGVALHKSFESYIAQIAELEDRDGMPKVTKVWCAVDCGVAVNPNIIAAQMEGGVGFGLGAILYDAITLGPGGRVQQSNFHNYPSIRIDAMPAVEVSIIDSSEHPTGVGEPGVPPIGPAVGNAWRALTGKAVHSLPFSDQPTA